VDLVAPSQRDDLQSYTDTGSDNGGKALAEVTLVEEVSDTGGIDDGSDISENDSKLSGGDTTDTSSK
jgi:hypothetical protein